MDKQDSSKSEVSVTNPDETDTYSEDYLRDDSSDNVKSVNEIDQSGNKQEVGQNEEMYSCTSFSESSDHLSADELYKSGSIYDSITPLCPPPPYSETAINRANSIDMLQKQQDWRAYRGSQSCENLTYSPRLSASSTYMSRLKTIHDTSPSVETYFTPARRRQSTSSVRVKSEGSGLATIVSRTSVFGRHMFLSPSYPSVRRSFSSSDGTVESMDTSPVSPDGRTPTIEFSLCGPGDGQHMDRAKSESELLESDSRSGMLWDAETASDSALNSPQSLQFRFSRTPDGNGSSVQLHGREDESLSSNTSCDTLNDDSEDSIQHHVGCDTPDCNDTPTQYEKSSVDVDKPTEVKMTGNTSDRLSDGSESRTGSPAENREISNGSNKPVGHTTTSDNIDETSDDNDTIDGRNTPVDISTMASYNIAKPLEDSETSNDSDKPSDDTKNSDDSDKPVEDAMYNAGVDKTSDNHDKPVKDGEPSDNHDKPVKNETSNDSDKISEITMTSDKPSNDTKTSDSIDKQSEKANIDNIDKPAEDEKTIDFIDKPSEVMKTSDISDKLSEDAKNIDYIDEPLHDNETSDINDRKSDNSNSNGNIDKPSDDTKTSNDIDKPSDDTKTSDDRDKPSDDTKTSDDSDKPSDDTKTSDDSDKPSDDTKTSDDSDKPSDDTKTSDDSDKPSDDTNTSDDSDKPSDDTKTSDDSDKPSDDTNTSDDSDKPSDDTNTSDDSDKPSDNTKTSDDSDKPVEDTTTTSTTTTTTTTTTNSTTTTSVSTADHPEASDRNISLPHDSSVIDQILFDKKNAETIKNNWQDNELSLGANCHEDQCVSGDSVCSGNIDQPAKASISVGAIDYENQTPSTENTICIVVQAEGESSDTQPTEHIVHEVIQGELDSVCSQELSQPTEGDICKDVLPHDSKDCVLNSKPEQGTGDGSQSYGNIDKTYHKSEQIHREENVCTNTESNGCEIEYSVDSQLRESVGESTDSTRDLGSDLRVGTSSHSTPLVAEDPSFTVISGSEKCSSIGKSRSRNLQSVNQYDHNVIIHVQGEPCNDDLPKGTGASALHNAGNCSEDGDEDLCDKSMCRDVPGSEQRDTDGTVGTPDSRQSDKHDIDVHEHSASPTSQSVQSTESKYSNVIVISGIEGSISKGRSDSVPMEEPTRAVSDQDRCMQFPDRSEGTEVHALKTRHSSEGRSKAFIKDMGGHGGRCRSLPKQHSVDSGISSDSGCSMDTFRHRHDSQARKSQRGTLPSRAEFTPPRSPRLQDVQTQTSEDRSSVKSLERRPTSGIETRTKDVGVQGEHFPEFDEPESPSGNSTSSRSNTARIRISYSERDLNNPSARNDKRNQRHPIRQSLSIDVPRMNGQNGDTSDVKSGRLPHPPAYIGTPFRCGSLQVLDADRRGGLAVTNTIAFRSSSLHSLSNPNLYPKDDRRSAFRPVRSSEQIHQVDNPESQTPALGAGSFRRISQSSSFDMPSKRRLRSSKSDLGLSHDTLKFIEKSKEIKIHTDEGSTEADKSRFESNEKMDIIPAIVQTPEHIRITVDDDANECENQLNYELMPIGAQRNDGVLSTAAVSHSTPCHVIAGDHITEVVFKPIKDDSGIKPKESDVILDNEATLTVEKSGGEHCVESDLVQQLDETSINIPDTTTSKRPEIAKPRHPGVPRKQDHDVGHHQQDQPQEHDEANRQKASPTNGHHPKDFHTGARKHTDKSRQQSRHMHKMEQQRQVREDSIEEIDSDLDNSNDGYFKTRVHVPMSPTSPGKIVMSPPGGKVTSPPSRNAMSPDGRNAVSPPRDIMSPVARNMMSPSERTTMSPVTRNMISPAERNMMSPSERNMMSPVARTMMSPAERNLMSPVARTIMPPTGRSVLSPTGISVTSPPPSTVMDPSRRSNAPSPDIHYDTRHPGRGTQQVGHRYPEHGPLHADDSHTHGKVHGQRLKVRAEIHVDTSHIAPYQKPESKSPQLRGSPTYRSKPKVPLSPRVRVISSQDYSEGSDVLYPMREEPERHRSHDKPMRDVPDVRPSQHATKAPLATHDKQLPVSRPTVKRDGPVSLQDPVDSMNSQDGGGHAESKSTSSYSQMHSSSSNQASHAATNHSYSTAATDGRPQVNGNVVEERKNLKNLPLEEVVEKINVIVKDLGKLEDFHRGDGMRLQKMLGDFYWDYTSQRRQLGNTLAEAGYADITIKMLKSLNTIGIFKNDDVWFPAYYTYNTIWNYSDTSELLAKHLAEADAVRLLTLNCSHKPYLTNIHSKNVFYVMKASMSILHNIARNPDTKSFFKENKTAEVIMPFINMNDDMLRVLAMLTLAYIVEEEDNSKLIDETGTIKNVVMWIGKALENQKRRFKGFTPQELTQGLDKLAVNDGNKIKIIEEGSIPLFMKMITSDNEKEQSTASRCIWTLAFDKDVRKQLAEMEGLIPALDKLSDSRTKDVKKNAQGALWVLNGKGDAPTEKPKSARGKNHIFISYSWNEQEQVLAIRDKLRSEGYIVWVNVDEMGGSTLQAMAEAVENAAVVIVCMSEKYKQSPNCRTESEYTFQLRKDYIPLMMQKRYRPDGWLGMILGAKLFFDFSGKYPFEKSMSGLLKELRGRGQRSNLVTGHSKDEPDALEVTADNQLVQAGNPHRNTHPGTEMALAHGNRPIACNMNREEVQRWLIAHQLDGVIATLSQFDGRLLWQLREMKHEAPEYFYQCLEKRLALNLPDMLRLAAALDTLH